MFERDVFDRDRIMRALKAGLIHGLPPGRGAAVDWPTDAHLISVVVSLGSPRWAAEQMRSNPALRLAYYGVWCAVRAAEQGDAEAKEYVDVIRATFQQQRRARHIDDDPHADTVFPEGAA